MAPFPLTGVLPPFVAASSRAALRLQAVLLAALANPFANESCDGFARRAHLRDRHQLNRLLRAAGWPSYRDLLALTKVAVLAGHARQLGGSLRAAAIDVGTDAAIAYRAALRLTGLHWSELRFLTPDEIIVVGLQHVRSRTDRSAPHNS